MPRPTETSPQTLVNDNTGAAKRHLHWDFLAVGLILSILTVRFFRTIFTGKSLSDIYLTAHWDSLFYSLRNGLNFPMDSSLVLQFAPQTFFVAACWRDGLPLWNRFSGFGMPLLADPQTFVLSPLCLPFFLFPTMYVWNLSIVIKLALGAVSTYFLSRHLNANVLGSVTAAFVFTFCPWIQFESEMFGNGLCLAPLVILAFVRAAKVKSLWGSVLAGLIVAVDLLSAHPEIAFVTIVFGCLTLLFVDFEAHGKAFDWRLNLSKIFVAGVVSFGLAAPMLIPFAELLMNGETYKFSALGMSDISLSALIAVFIYPFLPVGSLWAGPLSWIALPAISLARWRHSSILFKTPIICLLLSALAATKSFPLSLLFTVPPFREVNSIYCLPVYALFLAVVSGLGVQALFELAQVDRREKSRHLEIFKIISLTSSIAALALAPLIFRLWQKNQFVIDFGFMQEIPQFAVKWWWFEALPVVCLLAINGRGTSPNIFKQLLAPSLVLLTGAFGLITISAESLPIRPAFAYPNALPVPISKQKETRAISIGTHVFRPATNLVYKIPMLTMWNPVFPKCFGKFIESCGATHTEANTHTFNANISPLLDLAGVKTIFASQPLLDDVEANHLTTLATHKYAVDNILFSKELVLSNVQFFIDRQSNTVFLRCLAYPLKSENNALCLEIKNGEKTLSALESQPIWSGKMGQTVVCSGPLPPDVSRAQFSLRVKTEDGSNLPATFASQGRIATDGSITIDRNDDTALLLNSASGRFKRQSQSGDITVFLNQTAKDKAFFARNIHWSDSREEALDWLNKHQAEIAHTIVLEKGQLNDFQKLYRTVSNGHEYVPTLTFDDAGTAKSEFEYSACSTNQNLNVLVGVLAPSVVTVSELYYPGWQAEIDGQPTPIFRANSIERAILVPAGTHRVKFKYRPLSVLVGFVLFAVTGISISVAWARHRIGKSKARKT